MDVFINYGPILVRRTWVQRRARRPQQLMGTQFSERLHGQIEGQRGSRAGSHCGFLARCMTEKAKRRLMSFYGSLIWAKMCKCLHAADDDKNHLLSPIEKDGIWVIEAAVGREMCAHSFWARLLFDVNFISRVPPLLVKKSNTILSCAATLQSSIWPWDSSSSMMKTGPSSGLGC